MFISGALAQDLEHAEVAYRHERSNGPTTHTGTPRRVRWAYRLRHAGPRQGRELG